MGLIEMRDKYRDKYSYVCEKCGKKTEFMADFCGHCGNIVPTEYRLHRTIEDYNIKKEYMPYLRKLPQAKQQQLAQIFEKKCSTQAEVNKKAGEVTENIKKQLSQR